MTTAAPLRTSDDVPEDTAIAADRKARIVLGAAEMAILAAMARSLRQVAARTLPAGAASRRVRVATAARLGAAITALRPLLGPLPDAARQPVRLAVARAQLTADATFGKAVV